MHMLDGVTEFIKMFFPQLVISNMLYLFILLLAILNFDSSMNESRSGDNERCATCDEVCIFVVT